MKKSAALTIALLLCCLMLLTACGDKEKKKDQETHADSTSKTTQETLKEQYTNENWLGWDTTEN